MSSPAQRVRVANKYVEQTEPLRQRCAELMAEIKAANRELAELYQKKIPNQNIVNPLDEKDETRYQYLQDKKSRTHAALKCTIAMLHDLREDIRLRILNWFARQTEEVSGDNWPAVQLVFGILKRDDTHRIDDVDIEIGDDKVIRAALKLYGPPTVYPRYNDGIGFCLRIDHSRNATAKRRCIRLSSSPAAKPKRNISFNPDTNLAEVRHYEVEKPMTQTR